MNKNIGILTWHYLDNYGSALQAYAMQKIFSSRGYNVEFINYRLNAKTGVIANVLREIKYHIPFNNYTHLRKMKFYRFRKKYFNESKIYSSKSELLNIKFNYNMIICGSDQIWSANRFDDVYFLNFNLPSNIIKVSYAASTIHDSYSTEQKAIIKHSLKNFNSKGISVREELGVKIINDIIDVHVTEVLDPTLILSQEEWNKFTTKPIYDNYIACYFIGEDDKYESIVNKVKDKYNADKIININIKDIHNFGQILKDASPEDFLSIIKNAKAIVTDSYHAVLFSIIFNKEFYAIKRFDDESIDNQNERIYNILKKVDYESRYLKYNDNLKEDKINYKILNSKLDKYKNSSISYLDELMGMINDD